MVSTEDVPTLLSNLCRSFTAVSTKHYTTKIEKQRLQEQHVSRLKNRAFDSLLFDYDENFSSEAVESQIETVKSQFPVTDLGPNNCELFQNDVTSLKAVNDEECIKVLSFLLPLAHSVVKENKQLLGYAALPQLPPLSGALLDEEEIFKYTPLLAPSQSHLYTYYPSSLFSDSVMTVADSAFSDGTASSTKQPFQQSNFPICDPMSYCQPPTTAYSSYDSQASGCDWLTHSSTTLYGALTNSYVSEDLQLTLELPPLDSAPVLFDYCHKSQGEITPTENAMTEQTLTTQYTHFRSDSGIGGEYVEEPRLEQFFQPISWELKRRCGGHVGCDIIEKPYLTEAGPETFDTLYRLQLSCQLQIEPEEREAKRHLYNVTMTDLMKDVSLLLVGVSSQCFILDTNSDSFSIKHNLVVSGLSTHSLASACKVLVDAGTNYYRLGNLCQSQVSGLTITAFLYSISQYLSTYTAVILEVASKARSPLHLTHLMNRQLQQLRLLARLCYCTEPGGIEYPPAELPDGVHLLSYIYSQAENFNSHHTYHLILTILQDTSKPYLRFLQDWVFLGRCSDPFEEFIITVDPFKLDTQDRTYWTNGYLLDDSMTSKCLFVGNDSEKIFVGGKSLALLRRIAPEHDILTVRCDVPRLDICLSEEQQLDISSQSTVYIETVKALVSHRMYTRKMILAEKEQKRVEVIREAQTVQAERLAAVYKRITEHQQRETRRKQKIYNELKSNMEEEASRKKQEVEEEKQHDRELIEKLTKREQLQTEADAKLEQQAREELTEYYRLLSETAAARERKALWRVRRHQLSAERERWFAERQLELTNQLLQLDTQPQQFKTVKKKWERPEELVIKEEVDKEEEMDPRADNSKDVKSTVAEESTVKGEKLYSAPTSSDILPPDPCGTPDEADKDETDAATGAEDLQMAAVSPLVDTSVSVDNTLLATSANLALNAVSADHTSLNTSSADISKHIEEVLSSSPLPLSARPPKRSTKAVEGKHASMTTFDREFLVCRPKRQQQPIKISEELFRTQSEEEVHSHLPQPSVTGGVLDVISRRRPAGVRMSATTQSDEVDRNVLRLEKFRTINKRGHASHSSIQDIMYYETQHDEVLPPGEIEAAPIQPIRLEDVEEENSQYDGHLPAEWVKHPSWLVDAYTSRDQGVDRKGVYLYEHVSLPTLLHQSVAVAISAQISLSNQAALSYFMIDLEFDKHMDILHSYLLLAKGEFCQAFTSPLFEKLHSIEGDQPLLSTYFLTDTLGKALQHAPLSDNQFTDNVTITKGKIPRLMETYTLNAFSWLSLTYKVPWPMNILITTEQVAMYEKVFSFMISLKHISYLLADSWLSLKLSTQTHSIGSESHQFRQLHLIRHDMQHFVKVMHGYLALQVTQVSWHQFQTELQTSVRDLDSLYESHMKFISRCLSRCFLSHKVQQIKQVVDGILKSIYKFHALLRLGHWQQNELGEFVHTEYDNIIKAYLPFKEFTQFLNKVLTKMTESDKNQHLQELQMMLNFNGYYTRQPMR